MGTRVYIGRLSYHTRERDVEKFFRNYGKIRDLMLKNGYGFVEFDDYRDADDAVYELNGKELCGERVVVEHARGRGMSRGDDYRSRDRDWGFPPRRQSRGGRGRDKYGPPSRTEYRVIVENLSSGVSWQNLKDYVRQGGEVTYADAHKQRRNEGIVEFATYKDMKNAMDKLDDTELNGRRIRLVEDKPTRKRRSSDSRSRSRSRSRSHSRSRSRRSRSHSKSRSRSRSGSRSASRGRDRDRKASRSASKSKSRSHSRSKSKSRSPSKSGSPEIKRSPERNDEQHEEPE